MPVTQIPNIKEPVQITDMQAIVDWRRNNPGLAPVNWNPGWMSRNWKDDPSQGQDNYYSRLYPCHGDWIISHVASGGSMHLWHRQAGYIKPLAETKTNEISSNQEPRWLPNGSVVFHWANGVYRWESGQNGIPEKLIDVPNLIPEGSGGEGAPSDDGRYYPIMTGKYEAGHYRDIRVGIADLQEKRTDLRTWGFKSNALDVSPDGRWFLILDHNPSRMGIYPLSDNGIDWDQGRTLNPDFSVGHSGWSCSEGGQVVIVYQNNDNDLMEVYIPATGRKYKVAHMKDDLKMWGNYPIGGFQNELKTMGFHISRGNQTTKGWCLVSTYAKEDFNSYANSIYMLRLDGSAEIRMVCRTNNLYRGYHSESPAALSKDGKRIYYGSNAGATRNVELMSVELPTGWDKDEPVIPQPGPGIPKDSRWTLGARSDTHRVYTNQYGDIVVDRIK